MAALSAVVIGTGWAGEGYVSALRRSGIEVLAVCGRTEETARALAARQAITDVRVDWRSALPELRPDIVVVATPAEVHCEVVQVAADNVCHVVCEKPLARSTAEAGRMVAAVEAAGVKHGYGATSRFGPVLEAARRSIIEGLIGELRSVEMIDHFGMPRLMPYCWIHNLALGGGILFNVYTHFLAQTQYVTGGSPQWAIGRADRVLERVPVGPVVHDFRTWLPLDPDAAESGEWRENDADLTATVVTGLELPNGRELNALFHSSAHDVACHPGHLAIYGTDGSLHLSGQIWYDQLTHLDPSGQQNDIQVDLPDDQVQAGWDRLIAEFAADIRGEANGGYPTFHDGHRANELIDQIR